MALLIHEAQSATAAGVACTSVLLHHSASWSKPATQNSSSGVRKARPLVMAFLA
jgi:hypothetical protein